MNNITPTPRLQTRLIHWIRYFFWCNKKHSKMFRRSDFELSDENTLVHGNSGHNLDVSESSIQMEKDTPAKRRSIEYVAQQ
jgi:hypothetical protein